MFDDNAYRAYLEQCRRAGQIAMNCHQWAAQQPPAIINIMNLTTAARIKNLLGNFTGSTLDLVLHQFLGGEIARKTNAARLAAGTHNLLGEKNPSRIRIANKTHNWLGGEYQRNQQLKLVAEGRHASHARVSKGTHNFLGENAPSQLVWECPNCSKRSKGKGNLTIHLRKCQGENK